MIVGILGLGSIGNRHAVNCMRLGHQVIAYDPAMSTPYTREHVMEHSEAILICSPTFNHIPDFIEAAGGPNGKHVLVEKPLAYDAPGAYLDGFFMGLKHLKPPKIIATGYNLRFHSCVRKAKEWLPQIGQVLSGSFSVLQKSEKAPYLRDGVIRNWASHEIDLARYLLGDMNVSSARAACDDYADYEAMITLHASASKSDVFVQADYYTDPEIRYFWIGGEKGSIWVNLVTRMAVLTLKDADQEHFRGSDTWDENYFDELSTFFQSIHEGKHMAPLASGEDGAAVHKLVMQAREKAGLP